jgi:hypothetical protein
MFRGEKLPHTSGASRREIAKACFQKSSRSVAV